jgi:anti-sigma factor RsiW
VRDVRGRLAAFPRGRERRGGRVFQDRFRCLTTVRGVTPLADYLGGALSEEERIRFEAHLAQSDGCSGYLEDMRRLIGSLHELPEPPPDAATRDAVVRASRDLRETT